jgi:hypothetical protein
VVGDGVAGEGGGALGETALESGVVAAAVAAEFGEGGGVAA